MAQILILEDDDLLRDVLTQSLCDEDHSVVPASGSLQALAEVEKQMFDLIISDVRMQGMDGLDCLAQIRVSHPKMRCIVITGYASEEAPVRAMGVDADEYLYKPVNLDDLCTAVERVLEGKEENKRYKSFFSGLSQRLKKALGREPLPDLEEFREKVFRNFYVACRSGVLKQEQAQAIWSHIHNLERRRLENPSPDMAEQFDHIVLLIHRSALDKRQIIPVGKGAPEQDAFEAFYNKLRDGDISLEKLKTSVLTFLLRKKAQASPPLRTFYEEIWGRLPEPEQAP